MAIQKVTTIDDLIAALGTEGITTITLASDIDLEGKSAAGSADILIDAGSYSFIASEGSSISGLNIVSTADAAIIVTGSNVSITNNIISTTGTAVKSDAGVANLVVTGNTISASGTDNVIDIANASGTLTVDNNTVTCSDVPMGVVVKDSTAAISVSGNAISYAIAKSGEAIAITAPKAAAITTDDNIFTNVTAAPLMAFATADASSIKVTVGSTQIGTYTDTKSAMTDAAAYAGSTVNFGSFAYASASVIEGDGVCFNTSGTYTLTGGEGAYLNYEVQLNSNKSEDVTAVMNITNANISAGKVNLYTNSTMTITNSTVNFDNFQSGSSWFGVKKNSVLTIDNSTVGYKANSTIVSSFYGPTMRIYGTMTVKNDSTLYSSVGSSYNAAEALNVCGNGTLTVTASTVYMAALNLGNEFSSNYFYGDVPATTTASVVLDNSKMYNSQYVGDNIGDRADGIIIGDGSTHAGSLTLTNGSVIDLVGDGSLSYYLKKVTVNSNGAINMDATSSMKVSTIANSGTITVDMTGATAAIYKLIDASAASDYGTYQFATGKDNGYTLTVKDNDLYASNVDMSTLQVNAAWATGYDIGDKVAEGYYYGINAFSSAKTALESMTAETTAVTVTGTITEEVLSPVVSLQSDVTLSGGTINWTISGEDPKYSAGGMVYILGNGTTPMHKLTIAAGATVNVPYTEGKLNNAFYIGYNSTESAELVVNGTVDCYQLYVSIGSKLTVTSTGKVITGTEDLIVRRYAVATIDGTDGDWSTDNVQAKFGYVELQGGTTTFKNTFVNAGSWINLYNRNNLADEIATLTIDNSMVIAGSLKTADATADKSGKYILQNGANVTASGSVSLTAKDEMTIADSTLSTDTFTNAGTVNVSGTSKLSATSFVGNLYLGSTDTATTLTTDGLTFDNSAAGRTIYITDGSTVTLSGSGFNFDEQSDYGVNIRNSATERSAEAHIGHTLNFENVTLTTDNQTFHSIYTNSGSTVNFSGSTIATQGHDTYLNTYGGTVNVKDDSDLGIGYTYVTGVFNVSGANTNYHTYYVNLYTAPEGYHAGILNLTDATMSVEYTVTVNATAKETKNYATGGSANASLNVSNATLTAGAIQNNAGGTVNISNSTVTTTGAISNASAINIDNSTVTSNQNFTNTGTVNVSGTSKLSISAATSSYIGDLNLGKVGVATTLTTDGLTFDNSAACRTIYITDGSTVTLSGSGFDFDEQSEDGVNIRNSVTERSAEEHIGHTLNFNSVTLTADQTFHSIYTNSGSTVNFSGSTIATTGNGTYLNTYGGTVNVSDASDLHTGWTNVTGEFNVSGKWTKYNTFSVKLFTAPEGYHAGILNLTDGAVMGVQYGIVVNEAAKETKNYATGGSANASLNISGSTLTAGSLTNNAGGSVNISGASKVSISTVAGNLNLGKVGVATTLTTDGLTFDNSAAGRTIYITDGSTVTLSGSGFNFDEQSNYGVNIRNSATERSAEEHIGHTLNFENVTLTTDNQTFHSIYTNSGSTVNFSGSTIATQGHDTYLNTYGGTVNVKDDSDLGIGYTYVTGVFNVSGANTNYHTYYVNLYTAPEGYHAGILNLTDATMSVEYTVTVNATAKETKNYATGGSANASLNISGSTLTAGAIQNNAGGSVAMTGVSSIAATSLVNNGTITIDASAYTSGWNKVIDVNSAITGSGTITVNNLNKGMKYIVLDNDVYIANIDCTDIVVNADWNYATGAAIEIGTKTYYYGYNAFNNLKDAAAAAEMDEKSKITLYASTTTPATKLSSASAFGGGQDVTITGSADINWNGWMMIGRDAESHGNVSKLAKLTFDAATVTSTSSTEFGFNISGAEKNSTTKGYGQLDIINGSDVTSSQVVNKNVLNVNTGSTLTANRFLNVAGRPAKETPSGEDYTAVMNVDNATVIVTTGYSGVNIKIGDEGKGEVNLTHGAILSTTEGILAQKSVININASTLTAAKAITNDGVINITGVSKLASASINGTGTVNVNNAVLSGSIVEEDGAVNSNVYTFTGTNKIEANMDLLGDTFRVYFGTEDDATDTTVTGSIRKTQGIKIGNDDVAMAATKDASFHKVTITGSTAKIDSWNDGLYTAQSSYVLVENGGTLKGGCLNAHGYIDVTGEGSSVITTGGRLNGETGKRAQVNVYNGAALNVVSLNIGHESSANRFADVNIDNGTFTSTDTINIDSAKTTVSTGGSTLNINNGVLDATTVNNYGTVNVTGASKISATTFKGNLNVGSTASVTTTITTDGFKQASGDIIIQDGSTVVFSGSGFDFNDTTQFYDSVNKYNGGDNDRAGFNLNFTNYTNTTGKRANAIYANGKSTVNFSGSTMKSISNFTYLNIYGGEANVFDASDVDFCYAQVTGELEIKGASTKFYATQLFVYNGYNASYSGGIVNVSNGATMTVRDYYNGTTVAEKYYYVTGGSTTGTINIDSATLSFVYGATNTININISGTGKITANGALVNNGTITIDASAYTSGVNTVIDVTEKSAGTGTLTVNNLQTGMSVLYMQDGDIAIGKVDTTTYAVNTAWATGYTTGDEVKVGEVSYFYGINAWGSAKDAFKIANLAADTTEVSFASDVSETIETAAAATTTKNFALANDLTISGSGKTVAGQSEMAISGGTCNVTWNVYSADSTVRTFTLAEGTTLSLKDKDTTELGKVVTLRFADDEVTSNKLNVVINGTLDADSVSFDDYSVVTVGNKGSVKTKTMFQVRGDFEVDGADGGWTAENPQFVVGTYMNVRSKAREGLSASRVASFKNTSIKIGPSNNKLDDLNVFQNGHFMADNTTVSIAGALKIGYDGDSITTGTVTLKNGSTLTANREWLTDDKGTDGIIIKSGTLNVIDSTVTVTGGVNNAGTISVNGGSTFTVGGDMSNTGTFSFVKATVTGKYTATDLAMNSGMTFTAGSIDVTGLTMSLGSTLNLGSATSTIGTVTVTGSLGAGDVYTIATGWSSAYASSITFNSATYTWDDTASAYVKEGNVYKFALTGGVLTAESTETPSPTTGSDVYVGNAVTGKSAGDKVTINGKTYVVGTNAFATTQAAVDAGKGTEVTKLSVSDNTAVTGNASLTNLNTLNVASGTNVITGKVALTSTTSNYLNVVSGSTVNGQAGSATDVSAAGKLTVQNDGHMDINVVATGDLDITNTSANTLIGELTGANVNVLNTAEGVVSGATLKATDSTDGDVSLNNLGTITGSTVIAPDVVEIYGTGSATDMTVSGKTLYMGDANVELVGGSFLTSDSSTIKLQYAKEADELVTITDNAVLTITGNDLTVASTIDAEDIDGAYYGTVKMNGTQTYTGIVEAKNIEVLSDADVTVSTGSFDFGTLTVTGTLNVNFNGLASFVAAGTVNGNGVLNITTDGDWAVNSSVVRDFSAFAGTVNMTKAGASITMGAGTTGLTAKQAYIGDAATMVATAGQTINLNGSSVTTGITFQGAGTLNVNADQTLTAKNTIALAQVAEGMTLTLQDNFSGNVTLDKAADTAVTTLVLDNSTMSLGGTITGDANDIVNVNKNATLAAAGALDAFKGTVTASTNTLVLSGANTTSALFTSADATAKIDANAALELSGAGALNGFSGTMELEGNALTLDEANNTGAIFTGTSASTITANKDQTFSAAYALGDGNTNFSGTVALGTNSLTLGGANITDATFTGAAASTITADETLSLTGTSALNGFSGTMALGSSLWLKGTNTTDAKFTGSYSIQLTTDQVFNGTGALDGFTGIVGVYGIGTSLTLGGVNTTTAGFEGDETSQSIILNADQTLERYGALNSFNGTIAAGTSTLTLSDANSTKVLFTGETTANIAFGTSQTFSSTGALDGYHGTVALGSTGTNVLELTGVNSTDATVTGGTGSVIAAMVDQTFSGNLSSFTGTIAAISTVTLSGTVADTLNLVGNKVVLNASNTDTITVNAKTALTALVANANITNIASGSFTTVDSTSGKITLTGGTVGTATSINGDINLNGSTATVTTIKTTSGDVTLTSGTVTDVTSTSGDITATTATVNNSIVSTSGNIDLTGWTADQSLVKLSTGGTVSVSDANKIKVTGTAEDDYAGSLNISVNADAATDAVLTLAGALAEDTAITVVADADHFANAYTLVTAGSMSFTDDWTLSLTVGSASGTIAVNNGAVIGDRLYLLTTNVGTTTDLVLTSWDTAHTVYVNNAWTADPFTEVPDTFYTPAKTVRRYVGYDAAGSIDKAITYIVGDTTGAATIELTQNDTYAIGTALGTADNKVTNMTLTSRADNDTETANAKVTGNINAGLATTLNLTNISATGSVFGAGTLNISGTALNRFSGSIIAANGALNITGGIYTSRYIVGGAYDANPTAATSVTLTGTADRLSIAGNIYGGSMADSTAVTQSGAASITVDTGTDKKVYLAGNIYAAGVARNSATLTMSGNRTVTFTGLGSNLSFTGRVSGGAQGTATVSGTADLAFSNFSGSFKASISDFDTITISGNSNVSFARRQTMTGSTAMNFTVTSATTAGTAMYTVRDMNSWEFGKSINVTVDGVTASSTVATYTLVSNYAAGFDGFTFKVAGVAATIGTAIVVGGCSYTLNYADNALTLDYVAAPLQSVNNALNLNWDDAASDDTTENLFASDDDLNLYDGINMTTSSAIDTMLGSDATGSDDSDKMVDLKAGKLA